MKVVSQKAPAAPADRVRYCVFRIGNHDFGLDVLEVREVFKPQRATLVPMAPKDIYGVLNLRGRIVTMIDLYEQLGLDKTERNRRPLSSLTSIVVEYRGELYALLVDSVGEVMALSAAGFENNPANLRGSWKNITKGIQRTDSGLLLVLDVEKALGFIEEWQRQA